jgi:integral membrane protein (TIGR03766 family)
MRDKFFSFSNSSIRILFYFLFALTFYFSLTSVNLTVGDSKYYGMSTTIVTTVFILAALLLIVAVATFNSLRKFLYFIFWEKGLLTSLCILLIVIVLQITFVYLVHPAIGFDVGAIHEALTNTWDPEIKAYYSMYPNNMLILLLQHGLSTLFNSNSWLFFDLITLLLVDLSVLFNISTVYVIDKKYIVPAIYIHSLWLLVFPMIIIPYTDTWVIPFVSGYLLSYSIIAFGKCKNIYKYFAALTFGICLITSYFMKPSAIIPVIAIIIIEILFTFKTKKQPENKLFLNKLSYLIMLLSTVIALWGIGKFVNQQTYIEVDPNRSIPVLHFMNMGLSNEGGYNPEDALMMGKLPTKKERIDYSKENIKKRLQEKGLGGYLVFLLNKHSNNTSDGTFAWQKEGHFISNEKQTVKIDNFSSAIKSFFYLYGEHISDYRFIAQVIWLIILSLILFGGIENIKFKQILRLGIIGGFLYLLLFEGGRSRYLIQFLPLILIFASLSSAKALTNIKRVFSWK